ncbi:MAG: GGDEF domain-containing protein, partial [Gammaproteobacteria bacterium]|nr:GGDEF domain-containing protein [Gammaproteobacteria bacterium]
LKAVNDSLGHAFGDLVLQRIAQRLQLQVRESDIVTRFGGDEFVILLAENCNAERAQQVCEKIIDSIGQPFEHNNQQVSVGASIGIAIYQEHGTTIEQLLKKSDAAMYEAKNSGKNCYRLASLTRC